jgi:hypothetical protein
MKKAISKIDFGKIKRRYLKVYFAVLSISIVSLGSLFPVAAATGFDTAGLKNGIQTGLTAVMGIIGGGLAIFGVIELVQSQGESDPNAKSTAIKKVAAGLGTILVGAILIPVFITSITF